ncbi:BON domain-containing protein [Paramagnetospirillum magneticum]|uniref:Predicted periplasmic or secreted lipoprotein n=1 Tax=Paramagnetospirillum magneticum (strain ATCC 700264 / AMB-1) TaxID=342108 RepID=Q2VYL7_PARM1|nr:BON domain-containing protein [Paramagnetospirillum magneticum]BAE53308.1 Predicted periplasmic or secreted lipoprotein [Paramagnetospirillum magneticum AMB-1]
MTGVRPLLNVLIIAAMGGLLSGCAATVVGAGASAGVAAAEERGLDGAVDDLKIRTEINHLWFQKDVEMYRKVNLNISEGRVMLTGVVPTDQARADAVRLSWQATGVKEVLNEIQVLAAGESGWDQANDLWIQNKLKARLLTDSDVKNINYVVDVTDSVVYLLGIAQSSAELDRVIAHARDVSGVKRVISHVRLKTDPRRNGG